MVLREIIEKFLLGEEKCVATLKSIYKAVKESEYKTNGKTIDCSVRTVLQRNPNSFRKVCKGIWMLKGEKATSLLINGDSRKMDEIEDGVIDLAINDHPWEDKKAHKSGNQKGFAEYDTFRYIQEDFDNKARVLKDGAYLVEFLPVESSTNWEYLSEIKQMAKKSGFKYYASCIWRKAEEGKINNGRTTKGVEQMIIFSKGNPRRLAPKGKPYMSHKMLSYEVFMPIKANEKNHQAEKPLELYKYLIEQFTEEKDICLDQFGGACNMLKASNLLNRFSIVYELSKEFVKKAVDRFNLIKLYEEDDTPLEEIKEESKNQTMIIQVIPNEATEFQINFLSMLKKTSMANLLTNEEWKQFETKEPFLVNELFTKANEEGYKSYSKPIFLPTDAETYSDIDAKFEEKYGEFVRCYYENVRIENYCYAEYKNLHKDATLNNYIQYLRLNYPNVNLERTRKILTENLLVAI